MSTPIPPTDPGPPPPGAGNGPDRSLGEIIGDITSDLGTLFKQELELAKTEIKQEATKAGKGAGMLGGAGVAGLLTLLFLSWTVVFLLDLFLPIWLAALIVTIIWGVVAAVLAASGRKKLKQVEPKPEATIQTLKEDAQWAKTPTRNG